MAQTNEDETPPAIRSQHILKVDPASPADSPFKSTTFDHTKKRSLHYPSHSQTLAALPPTPMSAYFDAEDVGVGFDEENEYTLSSSSSPPTSLGTSNFDRTAFPRLTNYNEGNSRSNYAEPSSSIKKSIAILNSNTDKAHPTNMSESDGNEASEGNRSFSSEVDSPGPVTPATPSNWKPRELTLLRARKGTWDSETNGQGNTTTSSSAATITPTANDKSSYRTLEGLGIRGVANSNANEVINRRSSRMIARDILPPITTSSPGTTHQRAQSSANNSNGSSSSGHAPRELKLAASIGPPSSTRMHNFTSGFPPFSRIPTSSNGSAYTSITAPQSVSAPSSSRIPVRHTPAFSPVASTQDQFASFAAPNSAASGSTIIAKQEPIMNEFEEMKHDKITSGISANVDALTLDEGLSNRQSHSSLLLSESSQRFSRSMDDLKAMLFGSDHSMTLMTEEERYLQHGNVEDTQQYVPLRKSLLKSVDGPGSQTHSFAQSLSVNSRRRKPPAPLILSPSPPSNYSHSSAGQSQPNSALSMSGKPSYKVASNQSSVTVNTEDDSLAIHHSQKPSSKPSTGLAPPSATYLLANQTPNSASGDHYLTPLQSPAVPLSGSSSHSAVPYEQTTHTAEDHETLVRAVSRVKKHMHDLFGEESSSSVDEKWKGAKEAKEEMSSDVEETLVKSSSVGTKISSNTHADEDSTSIASQMETPSVRSSEVGNAFEFDNIVDAKEARSDMQDSTDSSFLSNRPPSPEPLLNFNREIFAPVKEPVRKSPQEQPVKAELTQKPLGPPPAIPLPIVPGEGVIIGNKSKSTSPVLRNAKRISNQSQFGGPRRGSSPSVDMGAALSYQQDRSQANVSPTSTRRTADQFPGQAPIRQHKSKPSIVPAVPSFGYLVPSTSRESSSSNLSPVVSNAPMNPFKPRQDVEQFGTSRWSSGSEDEDDRPKSSGGRKSIGGRSKKGSQNGGIPTSLSSRRNTQSSTSSSLAPLKKSSLFSGLGLRKKSVPALVSDVSNQSSPMILASDSPAFSRGEGMKEFPFPNVQQPRLSLATSVRSNASNLPSSPVISSPVNNRAWPGQTAVEQNGSLRHLQRQVSTPHLRDRFSSLSRKPNQLTPRPSDASLATTASGSNDSSIPSPAMQFGPHGLGIQVAPERSMTTDSEMGNEPLQSLESRSSDTGVRFSIKSHQSGESIPNVHDRFEKHAAAVISARQQQKKEIKREVRQRSMTLHSGERSLFDARNAALRNGVPHSAIPPPLPFFPSEHDYEAEKAEEAHGRTTISPDETPRIAYASLSNSSHAHESVHSPDHVKTQQFSPRRRATDEDEGLFAMGQALVNSTSSPSVSSAAHKEWLFPTKSNQKAQKHHRIRANGPSSRPRYPSLTDLGREWQSSYPQEAFNAALGPALLEMTLQDANDFESSSSTSNTDDYGSSEHESGKQTDTLASRGRAMLGGNGKQGRDDLSSDDDHRKRRDGQQVKQEITTDVESTDSEDSYGVSEDETSHIDPRLVAGSSGKAKAAHLPSAASSDDVPLGKQIRNPTEILKKLQRSQTTGAMKGKSKTVSSSSGKVEVPSGKLGNSFDATALTDRLLTIQRSQSVNSKEKPLPQPFPNARKVQLRLSPASSNFQPSSDGATMYTASEMRSSAKQSEDESGAKALQSNGAQSTVVSDFAQTVRLRSQNRSRMRPVAMNFPENVALPTSSVHTSSDAPVVASSERPIERSHQTLPVKEQEPETIPKWEFVQQDTAPSNKQAIDVQAPNKQTVEYRIKIASPSGVKQQIVHEHKSATARELVRAMMRADVMPVDGRVGGWAIFDVCPEYGIERPLREYERAIDVIDTRFNPALDHFTVRRTDLAPYLSIQALPKTSPALAGWLYVQETGRKKGWNKRWFELRDQALYQAKSEKGREEVKMCDLSVYDVFVPIEGETWTAKAPKKSAFALKCSNKKEEELVIYFCLSDARAARHWITAINRARTFLMKSEKPHLFVQKEYTRAPQMKEVPNDNAPKSQSAGMPAPPVVPQRPLVNLNTEIFERGSLLNNNEINNGANQQEQESNINLPPRGSSASHRKPVPGQNDRFAGASSQFPTDEDQKRRFDEIREMERIQRSLGLPLIGVVEKSQQQQ
ncbi:uncharacterized protein FA14DRAFT_20425 [Meira miltonrushii]|uniref:PH domain-containing protein n=1 Tax=Meira miltonrushii TaxID=1280837 RepID=A0A316VJP0_9BASI|nr:uncharacterized protein FA14DRAFT_20425 [Meira miltonrushii]PWN37897.1 hypothetical protein FA14DRAFT_20425 [Meira miltonrushii]